MVLLIAAYFGVVASIWYFDTQPVASAIFMLVAVHALKP